MTTTDEQSTIERVFGPTPDTNGDTPPARSKLSPFEGLPVTESGIEIPGAAGGLRDALKVDPIEARKGERIHVVLACDVAKIRHDPLDTEELDGPQQRVHICKVVNAAIVDGALVDGALQAQAARIARAKEIEGQQSLDDTAGEQERAPLPTDPPFLGYDELGAKDVIQRVEELGDDDSDVDLADAIERWETAHGGRATILKAIKTWRDAG